MNLQSKVAIVTGASRGIGREEALMLGRCGATVVVNDVADKDTIQQVIDEIEAAGGSAKINQDDVSNFTAMGQLVEDTVDEFGQLDIVVNNAGILRDAMVFNLTESDWDQVQNVHLKGTFNLMHHASVYWRNAAKQGTVIQGRIVNTTSDVGLLGNMGQANYAAAKAGIAALTLTVAKEMARYGTKVNAICPVARTHMTTEGSPGLAMMMSNVEEKNGYDPIGPQNIAPLVAYLASEQCACTGEIIRVAGDKISLTRGWHNVAQVQNGQQIWDPNALGQAIEAELANAPAQDDITNVFMAAISS